MAAPSSLALLLVQMSFGCHFGQLVPIARHWPIGQVVPYRRMRGNGHGLAKNAAETNSSWWGFCAMVRVAAAFFVVVAWLSYDTQDVEYNAPTTPKPGKYTRFAWAGGTCPCFVWAGGTFSPVVLLCQFLVLAGNRFWFYILLMNLGYRTIQLWCCVSFFSSGGK